MPEPLLVHCKRCHRNVEPGKKHNEICAGFAGECWPWCSYPEPVSR